MNRKGEDFLSRFFGWFVVLSMIFAIMTFLMKIKFGWNIGTWLLSFGLGVLFSAAWGFFASLSGTSPPGMSDSKGSHSAPHPTVGVARVVAADPMIRRLVSETQQAWRDGRVPQMLTLPQSGQKAMQKMTALSDGKFFHVIDRLVGTMLVSAAAGGYGFEADEVLVGYLNGNYIMTTRAIYFFEQGRKAAPTKVVLLQDMQDYSRERPGEAHVVLRSGERITVRVKDLVPATSFVKSFLV